MGSGKKCTVKNCPNGRRNEGDPNVSIHVMPQNASEEMQKKWRDFCKTSFKTVIVCGNHFRKEDFATSEEYVNMFSGKRFLKKGVYPTIEVPENRQSPDTTEADNISNNQEDAGDDKESSDSAEDGRNHEDHSYIKVKATQITLPNDRFMFEEHINFVAVQNTDKEENFLTDASSPEYLEYDSQSSSSFIPEQSQRTKRKRLRSTENHCKESDSDENQVNPVQYSLNYGSVVDSKDLKILELERTIAKMKKRNDAELERIIFNSMKKRLSGVFTENQLNYALKRKKKIKWNRKELAKAFVLRSFGNRAYNYVKTILNYPLPSTRCLTRWAKTINIEDENSDSRAAAVMEILNRKNKLTAS
ncbi:uncharacterized protein LOC132264660 [Phlebotomus argentipes]|uniref:uncharacterized protein LOC132264660 n=1 Tax=Phlebotomus argentipes TaxID=94469 RepID=UPI002892980E|nr:uncharacterized protein LOC132264660 [Phlebotomus argentipes]